MYLLTATFIKTGAILSVLHKELRLKQTVFVLCHQEGSHTATSLFVRSSLFMIRMSIIYFNHIIPPISAESQHTSMFLSLRH